MQEDKSLNGSIVSKDNLSSSFESTIEEFDKKQLFTSISFISPSRVTECPRRLTYGLLSSKKDFNDFSNLSFLHEAYIRKKWIDFLRKCSNIKILGTDVSASDCHYNLNGESDAVIRFLDVQFSVKIYSVNSDDFSKIKEKGANKKDIIESIVYLWLLELQDALILYENRDNGEYCVFHIEKYCPIINAVKKKCLMLIDYKMRGEIPKIPYKSKDSKECLFCEYRSQC